MRQALLVAFGLFLSVASAQAAAPVEAYGRDPRVATVSLSPSGKYFVLLSSKGEERVIDIRATDRKTGLVMPVGEAKVRGFAWAGDEWLLVQLSSTVNAPQSGVPMQEMASLLYINLSTRKNDILFRNSSTMVNAIFGLVRTAQIDGRWQVFVGAIPLDRLRAEWAKGKAVAPDLYRVDLESGEAAKVVPAHGLSQAWLVDSHGAVVAHAHADNVGMNFAIYAGKDDRHVVRRRSWEDRLTFGGAGRSANTVVAFENDGETFALREMVLGGAGPGEILQQGKTTILWPARDPDTGLIVGLATEGTPGAQLFDAASQARLVAAQKAFPNDEMRLTSFSRNFEQMVVFTQGVTDAGTYWLVEIAKKSALPIGEARPDIKPADIGPMRLFSYKAADGLALDGVLTLPPGASNAGRPLIVMPHGGPLGGYNRIGFDPMAQVFASRGYAVFQPNFRGSGAHGVSFAHAGEGEYGGKILSDIADGVGALAAEGIIDPKRACIVGWDYGGYAALAGVTLQQGLYRCAVSIGGATNLVDMVSWTRDRSGANRAGVARWKRMTGTDSPKLLRQISPEEQAEKADAPILLLHGKDDSVVPIQQAEAMKRSLEEAGKAVEFVAFNDQDHSLSHEGARIEMLKKAVAFVEQHNPPN